jgi:acetyl esterase/lipase
MQPLGRKLSTRRSFPDHGYTPCFVADAVASRHAQNKELAAHRLRQQGVPVISTEMALFEWMGHADHPAFRDILGLVKSL